MDAGSPSGRLGLAALVAAAAAMLATGLVVSADSASSRAPGDDLLPDLVVQRPAELYLAEGGKEIRLRVSNTVANKGTGPLEIQGGGPGEECNLPGKPLGRHTLQNIFEDTSDPASPDYFDRATEGGEPDDQREAGCSRYHPAHDHWHFDNFARYGLFDDGTGKWAAGSRKVSFCVIDTGQPYPGLPGSPPPPGYYPQDPENPKFPTCSETSVDGLSIGWEDTYGASLPGQGIKVTGLRRGAYCLRIESDPVTGPGDSNGVLLESNEANNTRYIRLRMRPHKGVVNRLGSNCKSF
jgi:hypothetical protein